MPDRTPDYRRVADAIQARIDAGDLVPGQWLPPKERLAELLGVSLQAVIRGTDRLKARDVLEGHQGKGVRVAGADPIGEPPRRGDPSERIWERFTG